MKERDGTPHCPNCGVELPPKSNTTFNCPHCGVELIPRFSNKYQTTKKAGCLLAAYLMAWKTGWLTSFTNFVGFSVFLLGIYYLLAVLFWDVLIEHDFVRPSMYKVEDGTQVLGLTKEVAPLSLS